MAIQGGLEGYSVSKRFSIPHLELNITRKCSLNCDGCVVYSEHGLGQTSTLADTREYLRLWSKRLFPANFAILGGEPLLHKDLFGFVEAVHEYFPDSGRVLVTNGLQITKDEALLQLLLSTNTIIQISFHSDAPEYLETMREKIGILVGWRNQYGLKVIVLDCRVFTRFYQGSGSNMQPFADNDPQTSWNVCPGKYCKNLAYGRLTKCAQISYLKDVLNRVGCSESKPWEPYLQYNGIGVDCTDAQLEAFLSREGEKICGMCPAHPSQYYKDIYKRKQNETSNASVVNQSSTFDYIKYINSITPV